MKKILNIFLVALLPLLANAYDAEIDGIYYNFIPGDEVEVTFQKYENYNYISDYSGAVVIPASVTYKGTTYSVTSIGSYAFQNCSGMTSITIPNSVTTIFYGAFLGCSGLTSVTIPNSITYIGSYAFQNCSSMTTITIPNNVTRINDGVFSNCSGLTSVTIPNSITYIGSYAFRSCI